VGIDPSFAPFEFLDQQRNYSGIAPDYLALIGAKTGLRFEPAKAVPYDEAQQKVQARELDLLPTLGWTAGREKNFLLSHRYIEFKLALVFRKDSNIGKPGDLRGQRLAVQGETSNADFAVLSLGVELSPYSAEKDALLAVADGREAAMLGYLPTALYAIQELGLSNLDYITLDADNNNAFQMGVRNDWPELRDILNKALEAITPLEKAEIQSRWVRLDDGSTKWLLLILAVTIGVSLLIMAALQALVRQRTKELRKQTRLAMEASRSKSLFLARMSHEIRTPLNAIIGLSEVALRDNLSEQTRSNLEKILASGSNLLAIVNDILDISKIEAGNFEIKAKDFDVPSLINDVVQLNLVRIGSKNISFALKIRNNIPARLRGDELRLKQVLNNLLSNAFKYTEKGRVLFSVRSRSEGDEALLRCAVADTGVGIKKEELGKLFKEYSQMKSRPDHNVEGTGLGLSIAKHLAELMGGTIRVKSRYGTGSIFMVTFRLKIVDETPIDLETAENLRKLRFIKDRVLGHRNLIRAYMPQGRVLVVDDVMTNLAVARGLMIPYGLTIDCVRSGREAIDIIRAVSDKAPASEKYDIIFMDHMMPGLDGVEATRIIRKEIGTEYARSVPIVALTANALSGSREMFLQNGFNGFISKPIDIFELDAALNQWVNRKESAEIPDGAGR
jgi:signal transduction histidine kinase/AmiR/NasT family two-component response regulator